MFLDMTDQKMTAELFFDGERVGQLKNGHALRLVADPGRHTVKCQLSSHGLFQFQEVSVQEGEIHFFRQMAGVRKTNILDALFFPFLKLACTASLGQGEACDVADNWFVVNTLDHLEEPEGLMEIHNYEIVAD
ncbi:MAG: hypothetical protein HQL52_10365 [Magnetococcales bacterium]|nr:hypothetical protein [Magnetococcales bacterium]